MRRSTSVNERNSKRVNPQGKSLNGGGYIYRFNISSNIEKRGTRKNYVAYLTTEPHTR